MVVPQLFVHPEYWAKYTDIKSTLLGTIHVCLLLVILPRMLQKDLMILAQNGTTPVLEKLQQLFVQVEAVNLSLATAQSTSGLYTE